jgi:hypothetical protein
VSKSCQCLIQTRVRHRDTPNSRSVRASEPFCDYPQRDSNLYLEVKSLSSYHWGNTSTEWDFIIFIHKKKNLINDVMNSDSNDICSNILVKGTRDRDYNTSDDLHKRQNHPSIVSQYLRATLFKIENWQTMEPPLTLHQEISSLREAWVSQSLLLW